MREGRESGEAGREGRGRGEAGRDERGYEGGTWHLVP